jgi:SAM-dependent methyltransferase
MSTREHWEQVYGVKRPTEVSWYRAHLETSLALIEQAAPDRGSRIIDVGAGEATLVDDMLARGYGELTVLDISDKALAETRARLGELAQKVHWVCGDVTSVQLPVGRYDVWHDRAVFHFLTDPAQRAAYVQQVIRSVRTGGHVIVGTFGPEGPLQCSGLDVVRYDAGSLHREFGARFELVKHFDEAHHTPLGRSQQFVWCHCRLLAPGNRAASDRG